MTMCIILTADEADQVRGPSAIDPGHALEPVLREGDVYILGVQVLDDPAHAAHHEFLASLPTMDSEAADFPKEIVPADAAPRV